MSYPETVFVEHYEPDSRARVELANGRIVDVINGRYHDAGTSIILHGSKIESMPGFRDGPADVIPHFGIDPQGKAVLPGLFNTHIHGPKASPTMVPGLGDILRANW
jgi:adenine deaminase